MKKIAVLYHANCPDGFGGAWAAWKKFGNKADYVPVRYNIEPPPIRGKELYMVDFCYDEEHFINRLKKNNKSLAIIDHHLSAKKNFGMANGGVLDMEHSGATLAWMYFHPGKKIPKFLLHLEDMDLWRFKIKGTKEFAAFIELLPQSFKTWDKAIKNFEKPSSRKKFLNDGKLILKHNEMLMRKMVDKAATLVEFEGREVYALNTTILESELGHKLYEMKPPMSILWYVNKDGVKGSLRANGTVDVAKMASKFGGGGHKSSAGFRLSSLAKIPWKPVKRKNEK
jgi:nanoRNase/pAp phosphatase (c-di-AMP/oligoRNAs hydrolase)